MGCKGGSFHRWSTMIAFLGDSLLHELWRGRVVFSLSSGSFTTSQNTWSWKGTPHRQTFQHPSPSRVPYLDHVQKGFAYFQGWRLHDFSGQCVPVLNHPHRTKSIPFAQIRISMLPVIGHHWKEPSSILFAPSLLVLIQNNKFPLTWWIT